VEDRILLLALRGRDAPVIEQILERAGRHCLACTSCSHLAAELTCGAGAAVVTEESLAACDTAALLDALSGQPPWSDFPFILLSTKRSGRRPSTAQKLLEGLGNVVVLERPIHSETLGSAVASALRGRRRQYEARRHLQALERAETDLRGLNGTLESRISERTEELRQANNLLMQEIAERERAQAALVQSQKMDAIGQLTGGIAHDFNNLLTVIAGNFELIQRRAQDEKVTTLATYGLKASERAAKLTGQLLAFSRTGKLTLRPVNVNALIATMHELLPRSLGPDHRIDVRFADEELWALADANQLELAVLNLALNARDATPGGGTLRITSSCDKPHGLALPDDEYVVICVTDDGPGIPQHLVQKVFDPFFTTKALGKGTGLGLSQVYGIAQQSGGTARVESAEGQGCTVEIWLPRALPQTEDATAASLTLRPQMGAGYRVLVVEDDAAVRQFIVDCLRSLGFEVVETGDGSAALTQLERDMPDLMIVDYAMPGMNGVEVIRAAQNLRPQLPIILATGYADMDAVHGVINSDQVLRKPFQISDLASAIGHLVERPAVRIQAGG
jgi:signal transduction histidine kinase/ActR/RegA family two-component response regulator